jgi:hypothetical protein
MTAETSRDCTLNLLKARRIAAAVAAPVWRSESRRA